MKTKEKQFKTSEFILICVLAYHEIPIKAFESDPINPRRAVAVFAFSKDLEAIQSRLFEGEVSVEPIRFWSTVRDVKGRIRGALGQGWWN
ncbi:MAG: hypothetical protein AAB776_03070 [Patescibacteria group bacterium]